MEKISIFSWDCNTEDHSLYVWDSNQKELNFDGRVFQTVAELKKQFETLPPGSHILYDFGLQVPKELPLNGEPKMSMEACKDFCASRRITLDISACTQ